MDEFETIGDDLSGTVEELLNGEPTVIRPSLNLDQATWEGWFNNIILYAAQNPWDFIYYVLLCLSPFFLLSVFLSMKLAKALEAQEKDSKRKAKRDTNISKTRKTKGDWKHTDLFFLFLCVFWKFLYLLTIKVLTKCLLPISVFYYWG